MERGWNVMEKWRNTSKVEHVGMLPLLQVEITTYSVAVGCLGSPECAVRSPAIQSPRLPALHRPSTPKPEPEVWSWVIGVVIFIAIEGFQMPSKWLCSMLPPRAVGVVQLVHDQCDTCACHCA